VEHIDAWQHVSNILPSAFTDKALYTMVRARAERVAALELTTSVDCTRSGAWRGPAEHRS